MKRQGVKSIESGAWWNCILVPVLFGVDLDQVTYLLTSLSRCICRMGLKIVCISQGHGGD